MILLSWQTYCVCHYCQNYWFKCLAVSHVLNFEVSPMTLTFHQATHQGCIFSQLCLVGQCSSASKQQGKGWLGYKRRNETFKSATSTDVIDWLREPSIRSHLYSYNLITMDNRNYGGYGQGYNGQTPPMPFPMMAYNGMAPQDVAKLLHAASGLPPSMPPHPYHGMPPSMVLPKGPESRQPRWSDVEVRTITSLLWCFENKSIVRFHRRLTFLISFFI